MKHLKNFLITLIILSLSFVASVIFQDLIVDEHITTIFVFAVFLISLFTDGYVWGIVATVASVVAVNYAFTFPYFAFSFGLPQNFFSVFIMLVISLMTSTLTTKVKKWEAVKIEGEREKMRANLLRAVSHDLRTPLTTIYGSSSAILENYESLTEEQKLKMVGGIKQDSEWLIRMVENLLSVTKLEGASLKLIKTPTVLDELIESVFLKFKKRYPEQKVTLSLPEEMVIIPMDPILIEQVLVNILENAVQHAVGMTELSLSVNIASGKAVFVIADNGAGIDKKHLGSIFAGYMSADDGNSDNKQRNAGIGLSVCASIIKAHGGEIKAENRREGGAVFSFILDVEEDSNERK